MSTSESRANDALLSGVAGAVALTAVHQAARLVTDRAPRMDVIGVRALAKTAALGGADVRHYPSAWDAGLAPIQNQRLYKLALAGDLIANSAYYSLATNWTRGAALGVAAGVGALVLPQKLGLGTPPNSELISNQVMTVAWYVLGGLAAACTAHWLAEKRAALASDAGAVV